MDNNLSIVLYKEGNKKARCFSFEEAFENYVNAFLPRLHCQSYTLEFVSFYRYQLAVYLKSKPVFTLSLPEGDMISDLIKDAYDSFIEAVDASPFNITGDEFWIVLKNGIVVSFGYAKNYGYSFNNLKE